MMSLRPCYRALRGINDFLTIEQDLSHTVNGTLCASSNNVSGCLRSPHFSTRSIEDGVSIGICWILLLRHSFWPLKDLTSQGDEMHSMFKILPLMFVSFLNIRSEVAIFGSIVDFSSCIVGSE